MKDTFTAGSNSCPQYKDVNCALGPQYPYCDMTCPMNAYAEKSLRGMPEDKTDKECVGMYWGVPEDK